MNASKPSPSASEPSEPAASSASYRGIRIAQSDILAAGFSLREHGRRPQDRAD